MAANRLSGWERVGKTPGGSAIYRNPSGATVSRRQYENARAKQELGLRDWRAAVKFKQELKGDKNFNRMAAKEGKNTGRKAEEIKKSAEFQKRYRETFFRPDGSKKERLSKKAGGPLARFLEDMGLRYEGADWDIGDTPGGE